MRTDTGGVRGQRHSNLRQLSGIAVVLTVAALIGVGNASAAPRSGTSPVAAELAQQSTTARAKRAAGPWGWSTSARSWARANSVLPPRLMKRGATAKITRAQFAAALVKVEELRASRHGGQRRLAEAAPGKALPDAASGTLGARVVGMGWMRPVKGSFAPSTAITADDAALGMAGVLGVRSDVTTLAARLRTEVPGVSTNYTLAAAHAINRTLGLRFNVLDPYDRLELGPRESVNVAHGAYMLHIAATRLDSWKISEAQTLAATFDLPDLGANQATILRAAVKQLGQPYVWAGETEGRQSEGHAGFDCSGFTIRVINSAGVPSADIAPILERTSYAQSDIPTSKRIGAANLQPGDAMFFAPSSGATNPADNYHAGVYMGNGWFIHSSGGNGGVAINNLNGWWGTSFTWGRRALLRP